MARNAVNADNSSNVGNVPDKPTVSKKIENENDLVYAVAKLARHLADMKMDELRERNGYGCNTFHEARRKDRYKTRGEIIEEILLEEFSQEFPRDFAEE